MRPAPGTSCYFLLSWTCSIPNPHQGQTNIFTIHQKSDCELFLPHSICLWSCYETNLVLHQLTKNSEIPGREYAHCFQHSKSNCKVMLEGGTTELALVFSWLLKYSNVTKYIDLISARRTEDRHWRNTLNNFWETGQKNSFRSKLHREVKFVFHANHSVWQV